ncbi:MAG: Gfo/Idh/MocA family protein [Beutenbergiaceae bacterium]
MKLGVGIVGAGPVVQSIHLPTLARLTDSFRIAMIMDTQPDLARTVADRVGARSTTELDSLLSDPGVDVVAICSPQQFHADQVIAALRAGKRAVLCEKPLAISHAQAAAIGTAARETRVPLLVGAMHVFDPTWLAIAEELTHLRRQAHTIRSSIVLPFNEHFETMATQVPERPVATMPEQDGQDARAAMIELAVLALAIHDLPLVRCFLPDARASVTAAEFLPPFGYGISVRARDTVIDISGAMQGHWQPQWQFEAISDTQRLQLDFTPSFVHAGSATATLTSAWSGGHRCATLGGFEHNGYQAEWSMVAQAAGGNLQQIPTIDQVITDIEFAVSIAQESAALQYGGVRR